MQQIQEQQLNIRQYLQILSRRRWVVITFFVVVMTIVTIATFKMKPVYQATTQLLIEKEYTQLAYQEGITVDISGTDYYLTQYKIIKSRSLARKVIEELNLDKHPEFTSANKDTVDLFLKRIIVRPIRNTRLVNLSAESHSPELATKIANTLAEFYVM